MDDDQNHPFFMRAALKEAQKALLCGEFPVGCVLVSDNDIIATGARTGTNDGIANEIDHAEMVALGRLRKLDMPPDHQGLTLYSTMEPCLMCFGALMISGIGRLVFAYEDTMGGGTRCDTANMTPLYQSNPMKIIPGILRNESLKLLKIFFSEPQNKYLRDSYLATYTLGQ